MQMRNTPFPHPPVFGQNSQYGGGFGTDWDYSSSNPDSINYQPLHSIRLATGGSSTPTREEIENFNRVRAKMGKPLLPLPPPPAQTRPPRLYGVGSGTTIDPQAAADQSGGVPVGVTPTGEEVFTPNVSSSSPKITATGVPVGGGTGVVKDPNGLSTFQLGVFGLIGAASAYLLFFSGDKKRGARHG